MPRAAVCEPFERSFIVESFQQRYGGKDVAVLCMIRCETISLGVAGISSAAAEMENSREEIIVKPIISTTARLEFEKGEGKPGLAGLPAPEHYLLFGFL